jgi:hypothetical protein
VRQFVLRFPDGGFLGTFPTWVVSDPRKALKFTHERALMAKALVPGAIVAQVKDGLAVFEGAAQ